MNWTRFSDGFSPAFDCGSYSIKYSDLVPGTTIVMHRSVAKKSYYFMCLTVKTVEKNKVKITWFYRQDDPGYPKVLHDWDGINSLDNEIDFLKNVAPQDIYVL